VREDIDRDALLARLKARGVDTRPFFVPMSELPHLGGCRKVGAEDDSCGVARALSRRGFNLPSSCTLEEKDIDTICAIVREALT
jgi:perosamine synthetase